MLIIKDVKTGIFYYQFTISIDSLPEPQKRKAKFFSLFYYSLIINHLVLQPRA